MAELPKELRDLKVAVGHDDLTVPYAGGEKIFMAIAETFPQADIFTSMITPGWANKISDLDKASNYSKNPSLRSGTFLSHESEKDKRKIITTFMQRIPFKRKLQKVLFCLYPLAFESLDLSDYDLVISSSSRFAHGVITKPETKHVCYMHSPGRMFWESGSYFADSPNLERILAPALSYLRLWDYTAAQRVDFFIANSKNIARKIKRYYGREAVVVYPFVDLERFEPSATFEVKEKNSGGLTSSGGYFLVVTRLAPWKRVEIAIEAAKQAEVSLKVVGRGPEFKRLRTLAKGSPKIEILGGVEDEELVKLYQNCTALVMTQEEDFGITSLEAQACGRPVIAYGAGGALETVLSGKTGQFFAAQTADSLAAALKGFNPSNYNPRDCRKNAERFSKKRFQRELLEVVEEMVSIK